VTMGIVSGLGRGGMGIVDYENFIQTDASINPGNSGGALVDTSGRLLGINTAIFSRDGGNQGIGFAIPSNLAQEVMQSIRKSGRVVRGYLGTVIQPITPELAEAFNIKESTGALVSDVTANSPAAKAGLQHGDIITALDGKKVEGPRELRLMIGALAPGSKVTLKVLRDGQEKEMEAELGELPQHAANISPHESAPPETPIFDGVQLGELDAQSRDQWQIPADKQGVVVEDIDPSSDAWQAGLRPGYLIEEINRQPVKNLGDANRLAKAANAKTPVLIRTWGQGQSRYLALGEKKE